MSSSDNTIDNLAAETRRPVLSAAGGGSKPIPTLTIAGHSKVNRVGEEAMLSELLSGGVVELSRLSPFFHVPGQEPERPLADPFLSRQSLCALSMTRGKLLLRRGPGSGEVQVNGIDLDGECSLDLDALDKGVVLHLARRCVLLLHLTKKPTVVRPASHPDLVGENEKMVDLRRQIAKVAPLPLKVLIRGETGSGKEIVARALHDMSRRKNEPYICVNMASVQPSLAASSLFGHARGAFSGAQRDHKGFMEQADGGTLFLDEVGEMPSEVQAMLLRSLESNEIHPLGTETARSIDLRLISATDTNLEEAIDGNKFNEPLYHRLAEFALSIPPLRDRRDDIGRLLVHLIRLAGQEMKVGDPLSSGSEERPWLSSSVVEELLNHHWPGNVRQLRNVARQLVVCHHDEERARISEVVQSALQGGRDITGNIQSSPQADEQPLVAKNLEAISEDDLVDALRQAQWRRDAAAKLLGISRTSIYQLIRKSKRLRTIQEIPSDELKQAFEAQRGDLLKMANALEISPHALKIRLKDEGLL